MYASVVKEPRNKNMTFLIYDGDVDWSSHFSLAVPVNLPDFSTNGVPSLGSTPYLRASTIFFSGHFCQFFIFRADIQTDPGGAA